MPLATDLTSLILDREELKDDGEMQMWLEDLKQRLVAAEGAGEDASRFPLNVEQLFDFAKYDEELWRMKQQLSPGARGDGDTPSNMANTIGTWLANIEKELAHVMWDAEKQASLEPIRRFTDHLSENDIILTFNYDTLVETALSARAQTWNHGLNDRDKGGVTVLKMHGSVDWILLEPRPEDVLDKFIKLFPRRYRNVDDRGHHVPQEEEDVRELWRANDIDVINSVIKMDEEGL
ncbi:hypothetical protein LCGC14_1903240, partial [marine sediment metagenome]